MELKFNLFFFVSSVIRHPILINLFLIMSPLILGVIAAAHTVGGPSVYVILSDQLPIHYRLDSVIPGAYISVYKQGSDTELDRQTVQGVVTGKEGVTTLNMCVSLSGASGRSNLAILPHWPY